MNFDIGRFGFKVKPVVLIEVQSEAEEAQALIRTGHQQHQELLDNALRGRDEGKKKSEMNCNG